MADVISAVRTYLLSRSAVTDLVGQRIYLDILPQKATTPAVAISKTSETDEHALSDRIGFVQTRIQFEAFADKRDVTDARLKANAVIDAIRSSGICALKGVTNGVDFRSVMVEDGQRNYIDYERGGGDAHRYVTSMDLQVTYLES